MADLIGAELDTIEKRIRGQLRPGPLTFGALQYRVGEVAQRRIEPILLRRALAELCNNHRPRRGQVAPGPWEPIPNVYVSSECGRDEALELAESAVVAASEFATNHWATPMAAIRESLAEFARWSFSPASDTLTEARRLAGDVLVTAESQSIDARSGDQRARIWFSHDLEWVQPYDWRLWAFLRTCVDDAVQPIVVARKLAVPTFSLFKHLGITGLQYYATMVRDDDTAAADRLKNQLRWTHLLWNSHFGQHRVMDHIALSLDRDVDTERAETAYRDIERAVHLGLGDPNASTPAHLRDWTAGTQLERSTRWVATLERWEMWEAYHTPRKRAKRLGDVSRVDSLSVHAQPTGTSTGTADSATRTPRLNDEGEPHTGYGWGRSTKRYRLGVRLR